MNAKHPSATWSQTFTVVVAILAMSAPASAQMRDSSARAMVRQALDDYSGGDVDGALARLRLTLHGCARNRCSPAMLGRIHVAIATVVGAGQSDPAGAQREFMLALSADPNARPDATYSTPDVLRAFQAASGGSGGAGDTNASPTSSNDGQDTERPPPVRESGESPDAEPTHPADGESAGGGASTSEPTVATPEQSRTYTFAVELEGGIGAAWLAQGMPEYDEYREWDYKGSGNFSCGQPNADGSNSLTCPYISQAGFAFAGIVSLSVRYNLLPRVGIGAFVRYQPQSSSVGILPDLFFGGRLYFALNSSGFVRRGPSIALFAGTGVGQMQATPPVGSGAAAAHIISGLNNVHLGLRFEYGFGVAHAGLEVSQNLQFPNVLLVTDVQALVGVHF